MNDAARRALGELLGPRYTHPELAPANERELLGALQILEAHRARREVRLSRRAFNRLEPVETVSGLVTAGAGVTLARIEAHAALQDLSLGPLTPASAAQELGAFLEGPLGGLRAAIGGRLEPLALAIEVLLPDGARYRSHPSPRSAAGPDLKGLFLGGEGRFGLVLSAQLRLYPRPPERRWLRLQAPDARRLTRALRRAVAAGAWIARAVLRGQLGYVELIGSSRGVERDERTVALAWEALGGSCRVEEPPSGAPLAHEQELGWEAILARLAEGGEVRLHRLTIESAVVEVDAPLAPAAWEGEWSALAQALDARSNQGGTA